MMILADGILTPDTFASYWPAWVALSVSGLIAVNRLIEESQKVAGFFGDWGRRRHDKAIKRHKIDLQAAVFADAIQEAVADARANWEKQENEAIIALNTRLGTVDEVLRRQNQDLTDVRAQQEIMAEYAEYEAIWHRRVRGLVMEHGSMECIPIDALPAHMNWWVFEAAYKRNGGGRTWWWPTNGDTPKVV